MSRETMTKRGAPSLEACLTDAAREACETGATWLVIRHRDTFAYSAASAAEFEGQPDLYRPWEVVVRVDSDGGARFE
jgi:hypothetical protein